MGNVATLKSPSTNDVGDDTLSGWLVGFHRELWRRGLTIRLVYIAACILLLLPGCEANRDEGPAQSSQPAVTAEKPRSEFAPAALLQESVPTHLVETATAALPVWRRYRSAKPALLLFSNAPFLNPVPDELTEQALDLVRSGSADRIHRRAVAISPNPLLLHNMAVDAALKAGFFSEVIWVLPSKDDAPLPPLESLKQELLNAGLATAEESESLTRQANFYSGVFRGAPFKIGNLAAIPQSEHPVVTHIDLGFFKPLYKNEVSTPLYPLIFNTLEKIRTSGQSCIGATVSHSNLGGLLALKVRFLGPDLAHLLSRPEALNADLPELQMRRTQNLYLEQFLKTEEILENCQRMAELAPEDAAVHYALYDVHRTLKKTDLALEHLDRAVALDPIYGIEYLRLAETAVTKKRPDAALKMLGKGKTVFPDNPLIPLTELNIRLMLGDKGAALKLVEQLEALPWSKSYDRDMPARLSNLKQAALGLPDRGPH